MMFVQHKQNNNAQNTIFKDINKICPQRSHFLPISCKILIFQRFLEFYFQNSFSNFQFEIQNFKFQIQVFLTRNIEDATELFAYIK